jgi:hypothetical protein
MSRWVGCGIARRSVDILTAALARSSSPITKAGSEAGIMASDAAVAASLAPQYGTPIETLRHALMRDVWGPPLGAARRRARPDCEGGRVR